MSELRDIAARPAGVAPRKLEPFENLPSPIFRTKDLLRESFGSNTHLAAASGQDIAALFAERERDRYAMHASHLNEQMVRVLRTIGYDVGFCRGSGQYLFDRQEGRYLDLLSGFGGFWIGRNHPTLREALKNVLDSELPNLVQLDVPTLAGILAERLLAHVPHLDKAFFTNSGAEAVEAAMKFARAATGRPGIVYCDHAFHGLTYGALSLNGDANFRDGFEPLLPGCVRIPFDDLPALEQALSTRDVAAFIVEPIQGKGVNLPSDGYLKDAAELCRRHGTFSPPEGFQPGRGPPGRFLAVEHGAVAPTRAVHHPQSHARKEAA